MVGGGCLVTRLLSGETLALPRELVDEGGLSQFPELATRTKKILHESAVIVARSNHSPRMNNELEE